MIEDTVDIKTKCENYIETHGCLNTLGECIKEKCYTYQLLQKLHEKEVECKEWMLKATSLDYADEINTLSDENTKLEKTIEEKNELLAALGCPTDACARRKIFTDLEMKLDKYEKALMEIHDYIRICGNGLDNQKIKELIEEVIDDPERFKSMLKE
jgi:hypothetical protein